MRSMTTASFFFLFACGDDDRVAIDSGPSSRDSGGGADTGASGDDGGGTDAPAGGDVFNVEFVTTAGTFVVEADRALAPNGVDRFRELVEAQYYDDCRFFRVVPGFVVQFGMNGDPDVNAMWDRRTIPDDPVVGSNTRGTVTFAATSAPNSRTTQLFINYGNNTFLNSMGFAPIGRLTSASKPPSRSTPSTARRRTRGASPPRATPTSTRTFRTSTPS
jgi:cyclophilin family peptidyl-prolyl cis-trans isomerase